MSKTRSLMFGGLCVLLASGVLGQRLAEAEPVFIENNSQIFRDFFGTNPYPVLFPEGDRLAFSAKVSGEDPANPGNPDPNLNPPPGSDVGLTTVTATSAVNNAMVDLVFFPSPAVPNNFVRSRPFDPSQFPTGDWVIRAENGSDFQERVNPGIGNVGRIPLVENPTLAGDGILSWTIPATSEFFNRIRVSILSGPDGLPPDLARFPGFPNGVPAGRILDQTFGLGPTATSINIKDPLNFRNGLQLIDGDNLVARIRLENRDNTRSDALGPIGRQINRSSTFVSFTVLPAGTPPVVLPTVDPDGVFNFNAAVQQGVPIVIDPRVAIGYDYEVGIGDPLFGSVRILTDVGDSFYDLFLFDGQDLVFVKELMVGELFTFGGFGVSTFRIAGIEASAGLDPTDTTAFMTEVTFASDGQFTGTMTPITLNIGVAVDIERARVEVRKGRFEIRGTFELGEASNGIDLFTEAVTVMFNGFTETIPAGSFFRDDDNEGFQFKGSSGGIKQMKIRDDGDFRVKAKDVDLSGIDLTKPVPFSLRIGDDDFGTTDIPFDNRGRFRK